jgi:hypothetical protein
LLCELYLVTGHGRNSNVEVQGALAHCCELINPNMTR